MATRELQIIDVKDCVEKKRQQKRWYIKQGDSKKLNKAWYGEKGEEKTGREKRGKIGQKAVEKMSSAKRTGMRRR